MSILPFRRRPLRSLIAALSLSTGLACPLLVAAQVRGGADRVATTAPSAGEAERAWRAGDRDAALQLVGTASLSDAGAQVAMLRAELLDARGALTEALPWYRRARAATTDAALRSRIDLRLAIVAAMRRPETLVGFARGRSAGEARALAAVVALLGRPGAALAMTPAGGGIADRLARAQWALAAGDAAAARAAAEQAVAAASDRDDRRYALALAVEAYRAGGDLPGALAFLDRQPADAATIGAKVDLLLELGRRAAAIALIERSTDPELRRRLSGVLDLVGDPAASEAEYRRLIAADPHQPDPYGRLAAFYLARGDEAQAAATYRALFAANRGRADVLTAGARLMIGMGLQDQAVALLGGSADDPAVAAATHLFLFETWLDRGDAARASAELEAVRRADPRGALVDDVADGYERLGRPDAAYALLRAAETGGRAPGYDRRVRLAQLAAATGRDDDALGRWRALWTDTDLPARRSYIERQIVALARKTGRLDALAQETAARLDAGTIRPGEIDLLVALRLAQERPDAAADAVRRFAARSGTGEVAGLQRLARLYAQVRDYDRLDATLRRLIAVDPANRDTHVRQLILTVLRRDGSVPPAQREAQLDALMARLSDTGEGGASAFKATVYAEASLDPQALAEVRRGVAAAPGDPDALLRLATELRRQRRSGEAIGLLQYAAERAATAPAFLSAIDGLIDMAADAPADDGGPASGALGWAERRVLERMATDGTTGRLLGLLADIAAADADYDLQIRATEASLPAAGAQRAFVLRELTTLSGGGASGGGGPSVIGDPGRRIVYARRLLALSKSFPPDVYADIARTLLAQGDEAGAERAFAMMSGLGGLVNVDEVKGDAYAAAGRPGQALTNYARALLADQTNLDLLVKTSILRERAGDDALARHWYWRGVQTLLARQPLVPFPPGDERGLDVRRYYPTLVEGLLLTLPGAADERAAIAAELDGRFAAEMARIDPAAPGALADHPRLALLVDLGHRLVDAGVEAPAIAGWDEQLDRRFVADAAYRRAASLRRHLTGRGDAVAAAADWPLAALTLQAGDVGDDELRLVLAMAADDAAATRAILADALAREERARAAAPGSVPAPAGATPYVLLLADAMDRLAPDRLRALAIDPLLASPVRDAVLFDLFRAAPDRYDRLQRAAGMPLLAASRLVELTIAGSDRPLGVSLRVSRRRAEGEADWLDHFAPDQLLALYDGFVTRLARGGGDTMLSDLALTAALRQPLDAAQAARLDAILSRDIAAVRSPGKPGSGAMVGRLLQWDAIAANRDLVLRAARRLAERSPGAALLPTVLDRWYAGDRDGAFAALTGLADAQRAEGREVPWFDRSVARHFADLGGRQLAALLADPAPDPKAAQAAYRRFVEGDGEATADQRLALTRKLAALDPGNPVYAARLLGLYADRQDWAALAPLLQAQVDARPDDLTGATMLALVYRLSRAPGRADAVAAKAGVDPDDPDWLVRLLNRSRAASARGDAGLATRFAAVYDAYAEADPARPAVRAVAARQDGGKARGRGDDAALGPLLATDVPPPRVLRAAWRASADVPSEGIPGRVRSALTDTIAAAIARPGPGATLFARPDMIAEVQRYPAVMAPEDQAQQQILYGIAAWGAVQDGQAAAALRALLDAVRSGAADADAVRRLMALADRLDAALAPADLAVLDARLRAMPAAAAGERLILAGIYARASDLPRAQAMLEAALLQILYPAGPLDAVPDLWGALARIVATVSRWPDGAARASVYDRLADIMAKRRLGPGGGDLPDLPPLAAPAAGAAGAPVR